MTKKKKKNVVSSGKRKFLHFLKLHFCWCRRHEDRNNEDNVFEDQNTSKDINNEQHMRRKDIKPIRG